ncbi:MAG TPA: tripartite tricarboxylate transporter TctB family protein [Mesorhizobium sp.]|jgi:putative tricarboxylic transport membrane protein|nr:tripartite tricarboxylate transporter TctB family protein [Mesorhizobium sp.]
MLHRHAGLKADAIAAVLLFALAIAFWFGAESLPQSRLGGAVGASGLPKLLAGLLGFLSALLFVQSLAARPAAGSEEPEDRDPRAHLRAGGILAIGAGVILALPWLGYALTMAALLLAVALFHGRVLSLRLVLGCALGGAAFHLLFVELLGVGMPPGIWPRLLAFAG